MIGVNKPLHRSNFGRTSDTERMIHPGRTVPALRAWRFHASRPGGFMHPGPTVSCIQARRADILTAGATKSPGYRTPKLFRKPEGLAE